MIFIAQFYCSRAKTLIHSRLVLHAFFCLYANIYPNGYAWRKFCNLCKNGLQVKIRYMLTFCHDDIGMSASNYSSVKEIKHNPASTKNIFSKDNDDTLSKHL